MDQQSQYQGTPPPGPAQPPPPGWGQPYGYAPPRRTNTLAIVALVAAFVMAPAGIVLGIVAKKQIRETGEDGDGLALAAIIVGAIGTVMFVLMILLTLLLFGATAVTVDQLPDVHVTMQSTPLPGG